MSEKTKVYIMAKWLVEGGEVGADDVEFAEAFVMMKKLADSGCREDLNCTFSKNDMVNADVHAIAGYIKEHMDNVLGEHNDNPFGGNVYANANSDRMDALDYDAYGYDDREVVDENIRDLYPLSAAKWLARMSDAELSQEDREKYETELTAAMVLAWKMHNNYRKINETYLTAYDMKNADSKEITSFLEDCLYEIIYSKEIDSSAWWKDKDIDAQKIGDYSRSEVIEALTSALALYGTDMDNIDRDTVERMIKGFASSQKDLYDDAKEDAAAYVNSQLKKDPVRSAGTENIIISLEGTESYLEAQMSQDTSYPGVDIQCNNNGGAAPGPRMLLEMDGGELRALIWNNDYKEDEQPVEEICLGNFKAPSGDAYTANIRDGYFEVIVPGSGRFAVFKTSSEIDEDEPLSQGDITVRFMPEGSDRSCDIGASFGLAPDHVLLVFDYETVSYLRINQCDPDKYIKDIAKEAFELETWFIGSLSGGIEPPRDIHSVTRHKDGSVIITYSKPATCGLSDCRYHNTDTGEHIAVYTFNNGQIQLDGGDVFPSISGWNDPEYAEKAAEFFTRYGYKVPEEIHATAKGNSICSDDPER